MPLSVSPLSLPREQPDRTRYFAGRSVFLSQAAETRLPRPRQLPASKHQHRHRREGRGGEDGGDEEVAPIEEDVDDEDGDFSSFSRILLS